MSGQDNSSRWLSFLRSFAVIGRQDDDRRSKARRLLVNMTVILLYLMEIWKQLLSTRMTGLPEYYVGNTITRIGNIHDLAEAVAATGILLSALFRMMLAVSLVSADANAVVVQSLVELDSESFACPVQRRKEKLAGILYKGTLYTVFSSSISSMFMLTCVAVNNILSSVSAVETTL